MSLASVEEYGVGIICALPKEMLAVEAMLDLGYKKLRSKVDRDSNSYTVGQVHGHKVVIACLPKGVYGVVAAATAATHMLRTFGGIRIGLMVGIGGGIPEPKGDGKIRLGDVVVSQPCDTHGGVVLHDQGKDIDDQFILKGFLNRPPTLLLTALSALDAAPGTTRRNLRNNISDMIRRAADEDDGYEFPGPDRDILYCAKCDRTRWTLWDWLVWILLLWLYPRWLCQLCREQTIPRSPNHTGTEVHYGIIASGSVLLKNRKERDRLRVDFGAKCIEMEAAGLMNDFPCLVIRGICDYADSHKNDDWQKYAAITAAAFAKLLLSTVSPAQIYEVQPATAIMETPHFSVPMERKLKSFFGREAELGKIATYFDHARRECDGPRMLVLRAMGGQGKSQIALEYCHSAREVYKAIFWINGSSILAMSQSIVGVAQQLDYAASASMPDDEARIKFAIRTIGELKYRWLLVFDNCDDVSSFLELQKKFLPHVGRGSILFTSRHRGLEGLGDILEVPPMPYKAGIELLLHRYPNVNVDDYYTEASEVVDRLGALALAIDQASAYMHYIRLPVDKLSTFLPMYFARRKEILQYTSQDFWKYSKLSSSSECERETALAAFTTWEMSFQQLLESEPNGDDVAHFLTLSAFFGLHVNESMFRLHWGPQNGATTWMNMFAKSSLASTRQEGLSHSPGIPNTPSDTNTGSSQAHDQTWSNDDYASWEPRHFWRYIHQAFQLSLLESISRAEEANEANFALHPLIRDWLQLRVTLEKRRMYTREATAVLTSSIKAYMARGSDAQMKTMMLLHVDSVIACDNEFFPDEHRLGHDISTCDNTHWIASFYRDQGQYGAALQLFCTELTTRDQILGIEHSDTLITMGNLAIVLKLQGKYSEAEQMLHKILGIRKRVLGIEHPDTLLSMNDFATLLRDQGKYGEAERTLRQVVKVQERILGMGNSHTESSTGNLATVLSEQGRYSEAEKTYRQILERREQRREQMSDMENLSTLNWMNSLAIVLSDQGQYSEAEQMLRQILKLRERILGAEHPDTLSCMNNLATVLNDEAKYSEAEQRLCLVVEVEQRTLGMENPSTLISMNSLASVLGNQGKDSEAERMYRQVLAIREVVLGTEHPSTLTSINNLATVLRRQEKYSEAAQMHRQVVEVRKQVLGSEHPDTLTSMNNLAIVLRRQYKYDEAEQIQVQAVRSSLITLGPQHPNTKIFYSTLRSILKDQGRETSEMNRMLQGTVGNTSSPPD